MLNSFAILFSQILRGQSILLKKIKYSFFLCHDLLIIVSLSFLKLFLWNDIKLSLFPEMSIDFSQKYILMLFRCLLVFYQMMISFFH